MSSLRDRLNAKNTVVNTGVSKLSRFKQGLSTGSPMTNTGGANDIRNKFQKRDANVLEKTWEDRDEKSKGGNSGKTIFNQELMAEYGIEDFKTNVGDHFFEVLPIAYDPLIPYFVELPVHFSVGFNNDAFICLHRFKNTSIRFQNRCYRCEKQDYMWKHIDDGTYTKDDAVALFPTDRATYLLWERTNELVSGESPNFIFKLWASPKSKVHKEIQEKVRNKITKATLDISDLSIGGEGRTVSLSIGQSKSGNTTFPTYGSFDLMPRDQPIPVQVIEKLDLIIAAALEKGFSNAIEMFLNIPQYEEVKESMDTEEEMKAGENNTTTGSGTQSFKDRLANQQQETAKTQTGNYASEEELLADLEVLQQELQGMAINPLQFKNWLRTNNFTDAVDATPSEAIDYVIESMYVEEMQKIQG